MFANTQVTQGKPLLSYVIASSNMRYIEINERDIYLRDDPQLGPVLRGEIPECGADCHANLSQMLLEQAMSCDDCRDQAATARHAFVTLCSTVVQALAPEWMFTHPTFSDIDKLLDKILISK